jgi:RimJ/RimL family protein N-acetyltransferase
MFDLKKYKKETKLKDGTKVLLRPMTSEDQDALYSFFKSVPSEDARYLRDDVASRLIVEKWAKNLDFEKTLPLIALKNGTIIADATLNRRRFGWKWHLGTVRLFVHKDYRKVGLGLLMIQEIADIAFKLELEKLIAEVPDINISAINAFTKAGFYRAATIPNLVKDRENRPLDVAVMIKDIRPARDETYEYDF